MVVFVVFIFFPRDIELQEWADLLCEEHIANFIENNFYEIISHLAEIFLGVGFQAIFIKITSELCHVTVQIIHHKELNEKFLGKDDLSRF